MKEEALKLADELEKGLYNLNNIDFANTSAMIRRLVEELDSMKKYVGFKDSGYDIIQLPQQTKPLSDEEISDVADEVDKQYATDPEWIFFFARAIEERHGIK